MGSLLLRKMDTFEYLKVNLLKSVDLRVGFVNDAGELTCKNFDRNICVGKGCLLVLKNDLSICCSFNQA